MSDYTFVQAELARIEQDYERSKSRFDDILIIAERNTVETVRLNELRSLSALVSDLLADDASLLLTLAYMRALSDDIYIIETCVREYGDPAGRERLKNAVIEITGAFRHIEALLPLLRKNREQIRQRGAHSQ